ncbi:hypothetical protein KFE98_07275 [bacterium SCSIO 12741]|nr:hypothetical protein KFE98_07275 [bacterium SCSIO 12741]
MTPQKIAIVSNSPAKALGWAQQIESSGNYLVNCFHPQQWKTLNVPGAFSCLIILESADSDISYREIRRLISRPEVLPTVILSDVENHLQRALQLLRHGACDYIINNSRAFSQLIPCIQQMHRQKQDQQELQHLKTKSKRTLKQTVFVISLFLTCALIAASM